MNAIKNFIQKLLGTHTVDNVIGQAEAVIQRVESVVEHQTALAVEHASAATAHLKAQRDAEIEKLRASKLAQKLRDFFA